MEKSQELSNVIEYVIVAVRALHETWSVTTHTIQSSVHACCPGVPPYFYATITSYMCSINETLYELSVAAVTC